MDQKGMFIHPLFVFTPDIYRSQILGFSRGFNG
jgi:hypothetical protein